MNCTKTAAIILLALIMVTACTPGAPSSVAPTDPPTAATFTDPFAYCAAVGTIDKPDARYTGTPVPDEIIAGFKTAARLEASTEPIDMFRKTTIWRCMGGKVYACNFGANLPCDSRANTNKTPSLEMNDYCKANPGSDFIPMSVTGHDTIFSWHCSNGSAAVLDQVEKVDAAGYIQQIWYPIAPTGAGTQAVPSPTASAQGGGQILFASNRGGSYSDLYVLDLADGQATRLTQGESNTFPGPFSPDGTKILFTGFGLTHSYVGLMNADGSGLTDLRNVPNSDEAFPAWSPDGKRIAFTSRRDGNNEVYVMDADGSNPTRLTNNPKDDFAPAWSPDGARIAFVSDRDNQMGVYSLYVMNADGTGVIRLTKDQSNDYGPDWSPDGKRIAYYSVRGGQADIYLVNTDGSNEVNLTNNPADDTAPRWSPDGSEIAFQSQRDGNWEIYVMNADGSAPRNVTNNAADDEKPYWKP